MNPLQKAARAALIAPIRWYQRWLSPALGRNCRFTPSCSQYTIEAIQTHGCLKGLLLGAWRPGATPSAAGALTPCPKRAVGRTRPGNFLRPGCFPQDIGLLVENEPFFFLCFL